ncbi:MAG: helix-turn-helix transcriptional regulator [Alphaproteobacteria bacterium]|nr:helix-turn-helix transcriptional regulator [Alphaproteobacteria bacterium]MBP7763205.1 helix-turn-helix transcriptional regulator [Alphaproteobacteria bacterium]
MVKGKETFGGRVRRKRMEKQITLRKFAEMIDVSPTYISQIERDEFKPPSDDKIREISKVLGEDEDEMLALAERVPADLPGIIQKHPKEVATFLRTAKGFSREDWKKLTQEIADKPTGKKGKDQ